MLDLVQISKGQVIYLSRYLIFLNQTALKDKERDGERCAGGAMVKMHPIHPGFDLYPSLSYWLGILKMYITRSLLLP